MDSIDDQAVSRTFIWSADASQLRSADEDSRNDPAEAFLLPDTVVDQKYRVESLLGSGGMGAVYRVTHLMLDKEMALKTLRSSSISDRAWHRFQREAQSIAKIKHSNIVQVFDFGISEAGAPYYTMELLEGEALFDRLGKKGRLTIAESLAIFTTMANAMAHAHKLGIIHRDIKPGNIFIETSGPKENVKIVDFGLAQLVYSTEKEAQELTAAGMAFGSPLYMSPEQALGQPTNEATDIYSFGCSLYFTLTGHPPFFGQNFLTTIAMRLTEDAPPLVHKAPSLKFPERLQGIMNRLLAREASERYQSFEEVAKELRALDPKLVANADLENRSAGASGTGATAKPHISGRAGGGTASGRSASGGSASGRSASGRSASGKNAGEQEASQEYSLDPARRNLLHKNMLWALYGGIAICLLGFVAFTMVIGPHKKSGTPNLMDVPAIFSPQSTGLDTVVPDDESLVDRPKLTTSRLPNGDVVYDFRKSMAPFCKIQDRYGRFQQYYERIVFPKEEKIFVRATQYLSEHPADMAKLKDGNIYELSFSNELGWNGSHLKALKEWKDLKGLVLSRFKLKVEDLDIIDGMPELVHLSLSDTGLTGDQMLHMRIPPKLKYLELNGLKHLGPFLDRLAGNPTLQNLSIKDAGITGDDIKKIAKIPELAIVTLGDNPLTTRDLAPVSSMDNLFQLGILNLEITPEIIEIIRPMKRLSILHIDDSGWSAADKQRLRDARPHCQIRDLPEIKWKPIQPD